jgi:hypothetical protein
MPDTTSRANARTLPDDLNLAEKEAHFRRKSWNAAYAEYLAAVSDQNALDQDDSDEACEKRSRRVDKAVAALISTRAPFGWALMQKWSVIEEILGEDTEAGEPAYQIVILGLAALKADVLAIGLEA